MNLHQKLLGLPFVYDRVRPLVIGGHDISPFYEALELGSDDILLDLGCGTGDALKYVHTFARYAGFDTDPVAIEAAKSRYQGRPNVSFVCKPCMAEDVRALAPTVVVMSGLLHHLSDADAHTLLSLAGSAESVRRIATLDIVYLPGLQHSVSNVLAALDRGRHCRRPDGYRTLARRAGLRLVDDDLVWCHPTSRRARYFSMTLERGGGTAPSRA